MAIENSAPIVVETDKGLYCPSGDFYIDPWYPVQRAIITHAHSDHARRGHQHYLAATAGKAILQQRVGQDGEFQFVNFGEEINHRGVRITLFPSGHMTGAAQVRVQSGNRTTVFTGDYKLQSDPTCEGFVPVRCDTFITESTFGLPVFRWGPTVDAIAQIHEWWRTNQEQGRCSLLLAYSIGKAQRLLASIDATIGPLVAHGAIVRANEAYRECLVHLPEVLDVDSYPSDLPWSRALVLAPPSAYGSPWVRRFGELSVATASGWMQVRGFRRRSNFDRGFVISDHVDWPDLLLAISQSEAENVWVTHGFTRQVARYLNERGINSREIQTRYVGQDENPNSQVEPPQ